MKILTRIEFLVLMFLFVLKSEASEISSNASPVIAQILNRKITADEIGLKYDTNKEPIIPKDSDPSYITNNPVNGLGDLVMQEVWSDYVDKNKLKATDEEIREYKNYTDQSMTKNRIRWQKQLEEMEIRLKDKTLTQKERE